MPSEQPTERASHGSGVRGAYRCLRAETDAGPIAAALHAPFFWVVAYGHRHELAARVNNGD